MAVVRRRGGGGVSELNQKNIPVMVSDLEESAGT